MVDKYSFAYCYKLTKVFIEWDKGSVLLWTLLPVTSLNFSLICFIVVAVLTWADSWMV